MSLSTAGSCGPGKAGRIRKAELRLQLALAIGRLCTQTWLLKCKCHQRKWASGTPYWVTLVLLFYISYSWFSRKHGLFKEMVWKEFPAPACLRSFMIFLCHTVYPVMLLGNCQSSLIPLPIYIFTYSDIYLFYISQVLLSYPLIYWYNISHIYIYMPFWGHVVNIGLI